MVSQPLNMRCATNADLQTFAQTFVASNKLCEFDRFHVTLSYAANQLICLVYDVTVRPQKNTILLFGCWKEGLFSAKYCINLLCCFVH